MPLSVRTATGWEDASELRYFDGSTWSHASEGYFRRNSQWVRFWPPRQPLAVSTFDSLSTALWHDLSDGWHGGTWGTNPEQGSHPSGAGHRGLWFYGNRPWASTLAVDGGRRITRIEVYLHRVSGHIGWGSTGNVRPRLWMHEYNSRPGGKPALFGGPHEAQSLARNEARWVDLPVSWGSHFLSGRARGIAVYTPTGGPYSAYRSRADSVTSGRIRITHE